MYDLLDELGLEEDNLEWYMLAACKGMHPNWFYDTYESDKIHAEQIDQMCLNCPVAVECLQEGQADKNWGVWGGIYLDLGRVDKNYNSHKTPIVWGELERIHGKDFL
jgi:Transcription factor WhiB